MDKRQQAVASFLAPELAPGEVITAVLSSGQSGPAPWLLVSFGLIGALVLGPLTRFYGVAVSNRRIFFVRQNWMERPKQTAGVYLTTQVRVIDFKPGVVFGSLRLGLPDAPDLKLNFRRPFRPQVEAVIAALSRPAR